MKTCPECGELIGDNVKECFKCHYNYSYGRVITPQERQIERTRAENLAQKKNEHKKEILANKEEQIKNNPLYEYKTVVINDNSNGTMDERSVQATLDKYSANGWKLHSIFTNEVGKSSTMATIGFIGGSINATIDQTVLIFERCIKA